MIELNKPYKASQIAEQLFGIKPKTFSNNRKKYMQHLSQYYEYKEEGRKIILTKELKPFQTKMEVRQHDKENKQAVYKQKVHGILDIQKLNSGVNIAQQIERYDNEFQHKRSTMLKYICPVMREDYKITGRIWCKKNPHKAFEYIPLTEQQYNELKSLLHKSESFVNAYEMHFYQEWQLGNKTEEQFNKAVGDLVKGKYSALFTVFKQKYGFTPVNVGEYELLTDQEKEQKRKQKQFSLDNIQDKQFNEWEVVEE